MKTLYYFLIGAIFLSSLNSSGEEETSGISPVSKSISSHLVLDYNYINTNINHTETSSTSGFLSLGADTNIIQHMFGVGYEYELLAHSFFSMTFHASGGFITGEDVQEAQGSGKNIDFTEKATGYYGAGGVSLNMNIRSNNRNTQYFAGVRQLSTSTNFFIRYYNTVSTDRPTEIEYDLSQSIVETSLGVRFFHYGKKMMFSTFSLNQLSYGNIKNSIDASAGSIDYDIDEDNFAKFKNQDYTFRFGFGFLY